MTEYCSDRVGCADKCRGGQEEPCDLRGTVWKERFSDASDGDPVAGFLFDGG